MPLRALISIALSATLAAAAAAQAPRRSETLLTKLLRIAGLSAAPSQMRGPGEELPRGNIWIVEVEGAARARPLTMPGGYRSPIVAPDRTTVLALRSDAIVQLSTSADGRERELVPRVNGIVKLVGIDGANAAEVVVLRDGSDGGSPLATVSLRTGAVTPLPLDPASEAERRMLAQIRAQERQYGDTVVYTRTESKPGLARPIEWIDVFVRRGTAAPQNVTRCDGLNCTQPSLSPDGRFLVFVQSDN